MPHCCITSVDAAYCYTRRSMVCLSVCLSVTIMSCAQMADRDDIWIVDLCGPKELCVRRESRSPMLRYNFEGDGAAHCKVQGIGTVCWELCKNGWTDRDAVWDMDLGVSKEALLDWVHIGTHWRIRLNHSCAAAMQPHVILLCSVTKSCHILTLVYFLINFLISWLANEFDGVLYNL